METSLVYWAHNGDWSVFLPDVSLADEDTGMVDALGQAEFKDLRLQPALKEVLHLQTQDVIELHLSFVQHTDAHQTPQQGITYTQNAQLQHLTCTSQTFNTLLWSGTPPLHHMVMCIKTVRDFKAWLSWLQTRKPHPQRDAWGLSHPGWEALEQLYGFWPEWTSPSRPHVCFSDHTRL